MASFDELDNIKFPPLIEQYERKIYDLHQLIEISKGLNSTLDYNVLIDSILLTCMGQLQLMNAGIFVVKALGGDRYSLHRNYKGFELDHSIEYSFSLRSSLVKFIEKDFRCYTYDEVMQNMDEESSLVLRNLKPDLIVPLQSKGEINGFLVLGDRINKTDWTETEQEYILNIASLAGIAINNAILYEMATTDMMTKLKIHHYFQAVLRDEINKSKKYSRPLSLIMADIDHFKKFNDVYGHIAGDEVLRKVAMTIKESVRLIDVAARYGGEEFAVILPKTDINEAIIVAERLRTNIENTTIIWNDKSLKVTISVGLTQFDSETDFDNESLIARADRALYVSKSEGRNRVSYL
ncbi:MAG TPA: diguanylate cyclase DgcA [Spirochaetota bacterium]|nr:diguanylate cyclase DgcA [Spirochaetota bacterium]